MHSKTNTPATAPSLLDRIAPIPAALVRLLEGALARSAERRTQRQAARALHAMNEHELADIGLTRSDIDFALWRANLDPLVELERARASTLAAQERRLRDGMRRRAT